MDFAQLRGASCMNPAARPAGVEIGIASVRAAGNGS